MSPRPRVWVCILIASVGLFISAAGGAAAAVPAPGTPISNPIAPQLLPEEDSGVINPGNCVYLTSAFGIPGEIVQCTLTENVIPGNVAILEGTGETSDILKFSDINGFNSGPTNIATLFSQGTDFGDARLASFSFSATEVNDAAAYFAGTNTYTILSPGGVVPEPSALTLFAPGTLGMMWFWRRKGGPIRK